MKVAYLAYDKTCLNSLSVLSNYFEHVDYYIVDKEQNLEPIETEQLGVFVDHLFIPPEETHWTAAHRQYLSLLGGSIREFKNQLQIEDKSSQAAYTEVQKKSTYEINHLSAIKDIVLQPKNRMVFLEKEKVGVKEYNFLMIEDHQIVTDNFQKFSKNILSKEAKNSHIMFSIVFDFETKKPRTQLQGQRPFIYIKDRHIETVVDNWSIFRIQEKVDGGLQLVVQQWVPYNQHKNSDYAAFMTQRTAQMIKEKFEIFQVTAVTASFVDSTNGFFEREAKVKNSLLCTTTPSFHFSSQEKVNHFLHDMIEKKVRELKKPQTKTFELGR